MGSLTVKNPDTGEQQTFPVEDNVCGTSACTGKQENGDCCQGGRCKCSDPKTVSPDDERHSQK